jgi:DNA helicase II / ATP-dependent DNA helicase PcrA
MILWTLRLFQNPEHEDILRNYQEQYQYILVDEFQDTNGAQSSILMKLIEYWEQPNVFVVGDDDQSIFEFQGARVKNMIDFFERYRSSGMHLIVLEENYRSGQPILDAAKHIIENNELRIIRHLDKLDTERPITKNLIASNREILKNEINLSICEYPNRLQEEIGILNKIKELHETGIAYKEIAVIYFMHKQSVELIRLFERHNIPYQTKRQINILDTVLIRNLVLLLRYIVAEFDKPYSGEELIYELLHVDFWGIKASDIAKLTAYMAKENRQKHDREEYDYLQWRDLLREGQLLHEIGISEPERITALSKLTDDAMLMLMNHPLQEILELLLNRSGIIAHILRSEEKSWLIELINTFFNFVREEMQRNANLDLKGLLILLERMRDNKLEIGIIRSSYAEDGVNLLTAHSAKGLEFQCVFMLHCLSDFWEPANKKSFNSFRFPDNLRKSDEETDSLEAARRLFYVAMTRAKTFLQLSYYAQHNNQKATKRSSFLDSLILDYGLQLMVCTVPKEQVMEEQFLLAEKNEMPDSARIDRDSISALLEDFRLSVSSLNTYLECPRSFYFQNILRIPSTSSVEALYGDAVHNALKKIFDVARAEGSEKLPGLQHFLEAFQQEMFKRSIQFSPKAYDDAIKLGMEQLPQYYDERAAVFNQQLREGVWTERPFRAVYNGVPLTGVIDKICISQSSEEEILHVVDYKTGKLDEKRFSPISSRNAKGGNYYRQLVFYKILIENSGVTTLKVKSAAIDYLSPSESETFPYKSMEINTADVEAVGHLITETYAKIQAQDFSEGCNKSYCKWCNFVKTQLSPDSFRDEEDELLDD